MSDIDHVSNCLGAALRGATEVHTAMCLFPSNHTAQANLNTALHNMLIVAEECRQSFAERSRAAAVKGAQDNG